MRQHRWYIWVEDYATDTILVLTIRLTLVFVALALAVAMLMGWLVDRAEKLTQRG